MVLVRHLTRLNELQKQYFPIYTYREGEPVMADLYEKDVEEYIHLSKSVFLNILANIQLQSLHFKCLKVIDMHSDHVSGQHSCTETRESTPVLLFTQVCLALSPSPSLSLSLSLSLCLSLSLSVSLATFKCLPARWCPVHTHRQADQRIKAHSAPCRAERALPSLPAILLPLSPLPSP